MTLSEQLLVTISQFILLFKMNYILLILLWLLIIFLDIVWSGLSKALKIILFPGILVYIGVLFLILSRSRRRMRPYRVIRFYYSRTSIAFKLTSPLEALKIIIGQSITAIIGSFLLFYISDNVTGIIAKVFLIWLGISIFISNLPSTSDIEALFLSIWANEPISALAMFVSFILLVLGIELFSVFLSISLTVIYLIIVLLLLPFEARSSESINLVDKEYVVIDEESLI